MRDVCKQRKSKQICEQRRRAALKEGLESLRTLTEEFIVPRHRYRRVPTRLQILKVALVRLRMNKGLHSFPDDLLLEDSNFMAMPCSFIKPGCKVTPNGFEIPPGGLPKDKLGILRMENKQRGERRRRNIQRLEHYLEEMCVPQQCLADLKKQELFKYIASSLAVLPPASKQERKKIVDIIENSYVLIPGFMGTPVSYKHAQKDL